jgi:hypothetical protein
MNMSEQKPTAPQTESKDDLGKGAQQGDNAKPGLQDKNEKRQGGQAGSHDKNG